MLPFDYSRCNPVTIGSFCLHCKRWAKHPNQTWGERTPQSSVDGPNSEDCRYIPIKEISDMR